MYRLFKIKMWYMGSSFFHYCQCQHLTNTNTQATALSNDDLPMYMEMLKQPHSRLKQRPRPRPRLRLRLRPRQRSGVVAIARARVAASAWARLWQDRKCGHKILRVLCVLVVAVRDILRSLRSPLDSSKLRSLLSMVCAWRA